MKELFLALTLSIGVGYDFEDDQTTYEQRDWKGIVQIESSHKDYSIGYWHSSQLNDGLKGAPEDQNLLYIKRDFKL